MSEVDDLLSLGEAFVAEPPPKPVARTRSRPREAQQADSAGDESPGGIQSPAGVQSPGGGAVAAEFSPAFGLRLSDEDVAHIAAIVSEVVAQHTAKLSDELDAVRSDVQSLLEPGEATEEGEDAGGTAKPPLFPLQKAEEEDSPTLKPTTQDSGDSAPSGDAKSAAQAAKPAEQADQVAATQKEPPAKVAVTVVNEARVLEEVTRHALTHHSSVLTILGAAVLLLAYSLGMGYGYVIGSDSEPWWSHSFASIFLAAPTGIVLLPLAGFILFESAKDYDEFSRLRPTLRYTGLALLSVGLLLPFTALI